MKIVVMSFFALAASAACPPPLGEAQWKELVEGESEDPFNYASMRWLRM